MKLFTLVLAALTVAVVAQDEGGNPFGDAGSAVDSVFDDATSGLSSLTDEATSTLDSATDAIGSTISDLSASASGVLVSASSRGAGILSSASSAGGAGRTTSPPPPVNTPSAGARPALSASTSSRSEGAAMPTAMPALGMVAAGGVAALAAAAF